jgi:hypothetical protein
MPPTIPAAPPALPFTIPSFLAGILLGLAMAVAGHAPSEEGPTEKHEGGLGHPVGRHGEAGLTFRDLVRPRYIQVR